MNRELSVSKTRKTIEDMAGHLPGRSTGNGSDLERSRESFQ